MMGPGKYDDICTVARESAQAEAAILIIFEGDKGSGFSFQSILPSVGEKSIPGILRFMADAIEGGLS